MKKSSGPQSWQELRKALRTRKETINQRNRQIRALKKENQMLREALELSKGGGK